MIFPHLHLKLPLHSHSNISSTTAEFTVQGLLLQLKSLMHFPELHTLAYKGIKLKCCLLSIGANTGVCPHLNGIFFVRVPVL